ncbi:MAG: cytochrome c oxidase subunit II [Leptolyngbya sp. Prado105]|jgi:cytochrome c oxidase subunit 2|nr:cytochrome c oxidase subunit II [Leptolyngbya sp. Prado105]
MKQIPTSLLTLIAGVLITLISLWVSQNHHLLPVQASEQAPWVDDFFSVMVGIGTALFIVVQGTILFFTLKYHKPAGDETDGVPIEGNFALEILWTAIPSIIVVGLGIYSVDVYEHMGGISAGSAMAHVHSASTHAHHDPLGTAMAAPIIAEASSETSDAKTSIPTYGLTEGNEDGLNVNVTAMQYAWLFDYPAEGVMPGELHVPIGKKVVLNMKAQDVIHSFWVPQFRIKQDVIPGEQTQLQFVATRLGEYPIVCTELCGAYHGGMRSTVVVHTPEDYEKWVEETKVAQATETNRAVATLSDSEFLAPYAKDFGITADHLAHLHP